MKEEYWVGANGKPIAVGDMTEEHMRNALRKLIREGRIVSSKKAKVNLDHEIQDVSYYPDYLSYKGD